MYNIKQALEEISSIKETLDPEKMFQGIPICELTMITSEELERKKDEDIFNGTRTILDKKTTKISKITLIAMDGSQIQARLRRIALSAVIFGEKSTLNDSIVCPDNTSSTTPEVLAIIKALNKMQKIGLKNAVIITSDSTCAINYIYNLFNSPTPTRT